MTYRLRSLVGSAPAVVLWAGFILTLVVPIGLFLLVAIAPGVVGQGTGVSLHAFSLAMQGQTFRGLVDSFGVATTTALLAAAIGFGLAWLLQRTNVAGGRVWSLLMWVLLLTPTFLVSLGWERLLEPDGLLAQLGLPVSGISHAFFGPVGVIFVLITKSVPFSYLAIAPALGALGRSFEDAARIHGVGRWRTTLRIVVPMLAPGIWSALAIVFAESISDFGVASTIAATARFPVATLTLFNAIDNFPSNFPVAAAVSWMLVTLVGVALAAQAWTLRNRSYQVLNGRARPATRHRLGRVGMSAGLLVLIAIFGVSLGVPFVGAVSASLLEPAARSLAPGNYTLGFYTGLFADTTQLQPIMLSATMAAIAATVAAVLGVAVSRLLTRRSAGLAPRLLDLVMLAAVGLPGIVLGAGYIFAYNLPAVTGLGIRLYGTTLLLEVAYLANALPATARLLVGPMAQVEFSVLNAARVHGAGLVRAWAGTVLPLLSRALLWAWLFAFAGVMFELPVSQLLTPPGTQPLSVAIEHLFSLYTYGPAAALMVASVGVALAVILAVLAAFRLLAPRGWRRVGVSR